MNNLENIVYDDCFTISVADVKEAISKLKHGKASGCDHLSAEHFLYADPSICVLLSILFTSMLVHGHLPTKVMDTMIIPLIKNPNGDTSDKGNCLLHWSLLFLKTLNWFY